MKLGGVLVVVGLGGAAHADVLETGNLRVAVACTNRMEVPERGLVVSLDGAPLSPLGANAISSVVLRNDRPVVASIVTDVGYAAPAGWHRLRVAAPDCAAEERDVELTDARAVHVEGRLAIATSTMVGTVGAPDGWGFGVGGFAGTRPAFAGVETLGDSMKTYTTDEGGARGVWATLVYERRSLVVAADLAIGGGSYVGTVANTSPTAPSSSAIGYSADFLVNTFGLRVGGRLPLGSVALAAGSGIAASIFTTMDTHQPEGVFTPLGPDLAVYLPIWSSVTFKASCDWGVQGLASVDVDRKADTRMSLAAGLLYQPSAACREPAGVRVR